MALVECSGMGTTKITKDTKKDSARSARLVSDEADRLLAVSLGALGVLGGELARPFGFGARS